MNFRHYFFDDDQNLGFIGYVKGIGKFYYAKCKGDGGCLPDPVVDEYLVDI